MLAEHALDRVGKTGDRGASTDTRRGQQDQAAMRLTARKALGRERTEVPDVVGHHRAEFAGGDLENAARIRLITVE